MTAAARVVARTLPWGGILLAGAAAVLIAAVTRDTAAAALGLQLSGLLLAVMPVLAVEDPAGVTVAALPVRLAVRRLLAVAPVLALSAATWIVLLGRSGVPAAAASTLTLQVVAIALAGMASAALPRVSASAAAAALALAVAGGRLALPAWVLEPRSGDLRGLAVWVALAAAGATGLLWLSRDPAARR